MTSRDSISELKSPVLDSPGLFLITDQLKVGGTERQFVVLASLLADSFRLRLGCLQRVGPLLSELGEIAEFNPRGSFFSVQAHHVRMALGRYLREQEISVAQSFEFYSDLLMIPVARAVGVPVVIGSLRQLGDRIGPFRFAILSQVLRLCDRVVCNSAAAAARLRDYGLGDEKLVVIPNGVRIDAIAQVRPLLMPERRGVRVGLIGRMNEAVKNHAGFLRAAALVARRHPNTEFILVGDGPLRPKLEELSRRLGLESRVTFLGERRDIPNVLQALDVSVVPSFSESLSNVILESMAAGKPVVASRVGGNSELVQEGRTGLLVSPHDENELAEAISRLVSEPEIRHQFGTYAAEVVHQEYSLERMRQRFIELYRSLLDEKGWRPPIHRRSPKRREAGTGRLRVALVAPSLRKLGGQSVQADLLLRNWKNDPEVLATLVPTDPEFPRAIAWVEHIPYLRTVVRMPLYWTKLWQNLKRADVVHIFSASYWSFLLATAPACWIADWLGKTAIINYRSGEARDHLLHWRSALPVLRRADRLVVPSGYLVDVFREFGRCAEVVPNLVDLDQFNFRQRKPLRPRLVCTRGFEPYYDVALVVRAFAEVKKEFPDAELCLMGRGSLEQEIRELVAQLHLRDVEFAGWVDRRQIGRHYDAADIFVNASWLDNMPVSVLEAFAAGTPVVTTSPDGIRYIVEHERTGLLCAPKDWRALAQNVLRLLRDPELADRLALNAFEESRRYRWETVRRHWLAVYRGLPVGEGIRALESQESSSVAGNSWNSRR